MKSKPCNKCPWTEKGQPLITDEVRKSNIGDAWFCCHVNMGTCYGAKNIKYSNIKRAKSIMHTYSKPIESFDEALAYTIDNNKD